MARVHIADTTKTLEYHNPVTDGLEEYAIRLRGQFSTGEVGGPYGDTWVGYKVYTLEDWTIDDNLERLPDELRTLILSRQYDGEFIEALENAEVQ